MLCVISFTARGQSKIKTKDSVNMKNQIEGFYSWYIDMIKNNRENKDFNPSFVRRDDGMTTLDFKNYKDGLRRYKFSDEFIERKVNDYKPCVDNLRTVPYDSFVTFELDEHEQLKCDFSNTYEWTGGMEPKDKAELINLKLVDNNIIIGQLTFTSYNKPDGTAKVTFKKSNNDWRIHNIQLE